MDDLISRQAALDCFRGWIDQYGDIREPDEMPEYRWIEALPPAEPTIIRCKDCKCWDAFPSSTATPAYHECKRFIGTRLHTRANDYCSLAERMRDETRDHNPD